MPGKNKGKSPAENFGDMFKKFGDAMGEIFNDPELKKKAKEFGDSAVNSAKTFGERFKDEEVKGKFRDFGKATQDFGSSISDYFKDSGENDSSDSSKKKLNGKKSPRLDVEELKFDIVRINKILGLELSKAEIKLFLSKMGYGFEKGKVIVPCYRTDVLGQADLAEDVAIAYGYENFKAKIPNISTIAQENKFEQFKNKVAEILIGFGLIETNTYNLTSREIQEKQMRMSGEKLSLLEIENALNEEYDVMRAWMIPSLLEVFKNNKQYEYPQKIFEIGEVFTPKQISRVAVILADKFTNYTKIKQILEYLLCSFGVNYEIKETNHKSFISGRVGRVYVNGTAIAYLGEIHPQVLNNFSIDVPSSAFELNLTELFRILKK